MCANKIRKVLVVDDSAFMRKLITDILNSHPEIEVVGIARNGKDAIEKVKTLSPDVVTMDIEMPVMDGLEALKEIMDKHPVPVVMLSSTTKEGAENTILAMEYGAVDFVAKPGGAISLNLHDVKEEIIEKVYAASEVQITKLKRIMPKTRRNQTLTSARKTIQYRDENMVTELSARKENLKGARFKKFSKKAKTIVMIGTSTGGPRALQEVLTQLPGDIPAPILIVQHMPPGFTKSLANRLDGLCTIKVKEAENGDLLKNGTAYIAPGGKHLKVKKLGTSYIAKLDDVESPRLGHRPSVDVLFESASELSSVNYLTVIMTGMGNDGKDGIKRLNEKCETIVIVESPETSVVYGMPRAVIDAGLADEIENLTDIPKTIIEVLKS